MRYFLTTAFKSGKFCVGFFTLSAILLFVFLYPVFSNTDPMAMTGAMFERPNLSLYLSGELNNQSEEADPDHAALLAQFGLTLVQSDTPNVLRVLGTDNFGRDVLAQMVAGTKTSLTIGIISGITATLIGLTVGLLAGYIGGKVDNILTTVNNIFIVIPSIVVLILITASLSTRSFFTTAFILGITSWPWTARSVRAQTTSLRNRDHVNLSRLSGHSIPRIIVKDILPYLASYVMMAFILQVVVAILGEATLSMLGLGPQNVASLGMMMQWAMLFSALPAGAWWAFIPVLLTIALIAFSLNIMNSGLDQIFNPQLRS